MILRIFIFLISAFILFSGCKGDKQPEFVDEKSTANDKEELKKPDTNANHIDTVKKSDEDKDKFAYQRNEIPVAVISPLEATNYMGKYVTVKGFVADVYKSEKVAYLNFVEKYPDNPFSGVIFADKFNEFGDLQVYEKKNVEISGRVSTFRGKPQMILDKKSQIKIIN